MTQRMIKELTRRKQMAFQNDNWKEVKIVNKMLEMHKRGYHV